MRLRFWLLAMDIAYYLGGMRSAPYLWCLRRASDATVWERPRHEGELAALRSR